MYPSVIDVVVDSKLPYFERQFESLKAQTIQDFELLLVIGHPGAAVREFLETQTCSFDLCAIQEPPRDSYPARAAANNLGLRAATGDIYIGTQDDVILPENWLASHIAWQQRDDGPWFIYNRISNAMAYSNEDELWERISNPRQLPIVSRWQYASGHSFSLPMEYAKQIKHDERYCGHWGFEDIDWGRQAHNLGLKFAIDLDVIVEHQSHGERPDQKMTRDPNEFWEWLADRSINRRLFQDIHGFDPEYGSY